MLTIIIVLICWVLQEPSTFHELFILFITILWARLIIMLLFSQGNRGSERLSGLPRFAQQINSCPWIQTWVCSILKPVLTSLCLYHIAVVLSPCVGSWLSAWTTLAFDATLQSAPEFTFLLPFPGVHHFCVLTSLLRTDPDLLNHNLPFNTSPGVTQHMRSTG